MALVTTARARRKAAFASISTDVVQDFLDAAQDWIESYCDRKFESDTFSAVYNGKGEATLYLKNRPVTAINSCVITDPSGETETLTVSTDLVYQAENGALQFGPDNNSSYDLWPVGFQNIAINYTAGYAAGSIPDDVQEACVLRALVLFAESGEDMNAALVMQAVGEGSKNRNTPYIIDGWQAQVEKILAPYRRLGFV